MNTVSAGRVSRRASFPALGALAAFPWVSVLASIAKPLAIDGGPAAAPRTVRVGHASEIRTLSQASRIAGDGDVVEVAPGDYRRDTAVWRQRDLVIRGIGVRPRLIADGASAEGKAIFIVRGGRVRIENLEFSGARVRDRNGAGIRLEKGQLEIARCHFENNENGLLANNDEAIELSVDRCSFVANGAGDGQSHNLYAGRIGRLTVSSSYFARSRVGHLLKSRARECLVAYCRLSGEDGTTSYELEFPNGGSVRVLGCLIQQGPRLENPVIISYGAEGYRWPRNDLKVAFNTIVNDRPFGGIFMRVASGPARAEIVNNLLVGAGDLEVNLGSAVIRNMVGHRSDFANPNQMDYHLRKSSPRVGTAGPSGQLAPGSLYPEREYLHPAGSRDLPARIPLTPLSPGAFQMLAD